MVGMRGVGAKLFVQLIPRALDHDARDTVATRALLRCVDELRQPAGECATASIAARSMKNAVKSPGQSVRMVSCTSPVHRLRLQTGGLEYRVAGTSTLRHRDGWQPRCTGCARSSREVKTLRILGSSSNLNMNVRRPDRRWWRPRSNNVPINPIRGRVVTLSPRIGAPRYLTRSERVGIH